MPRGGPRLGAGRKKNGTNVLNAQKRHALAKFNDRLEEIESIQLLRPEEILLRVANNLPRPDGAAWTALELDAAKALLPYSIAKPASVNIHHVQRTDIRQHTDEELEQIAHSGRSGAGTYSAAQSPFLTVGMVRDSASADGDDTGEAP